MANDYKQDTGKAPLLSALQPFAPALYALARMMEDMKHKHRLAGSTDPFNQWAQLPAAKARMQEALERHLLPEDEGATLWSVNHKDGTHLHATHGLFNLLGALTLHIRDNAERCCGSPDAEVMKADGHHGSARCAHHAGLVDGRCSDCGETPLAGKLAPAPLHGPAGADWREYGASSCDGMLAVGLNVHHCELLAKHEGPCRSGRVQW